MGVEWVDYPARLLLYRVVWGEDRYELYEDTTILFSDEDLVQRLEQWQVPENGESPRH